MGENVALIYVFLGLIPAFIASSKGRSFIIWYIYGVFLWIIALIHAIIIKPIDEISDDIAIINSRGRECVWCKEIIKKDAIICKHCGRSVPELNEEDYKKYQDKIKERLQRKKELERIEIQEKHKSPKVLIFIFLIILAIGLINSLFS